MAAAVVLAFSKKRRIAEVFFSSPAMTTIQESSGGAASSGSSAGRIDQLPALANRNAATSAEERNGVGLVGEPAGIVGELGRIEPEVTEGIVGAAVDGLGEQPSALGDEPVIVAVDEDEPNGRSGVARKRSASDGLICTATRA